MRRSERIMELERMIEAKQRSVSGMARASERLTREIAVLRSAVRKELRKK